MIRKRGYLWQWLVENWARKDTNGSRLTKERTASRMRSLGMLKLYLEGWSYGELARIFRVSPGWLERSLYYAKLSIRRRLKRAGLSFPELLERQASELSDDPER